MGNWLYAVFPVLALALNVATQMTLVRWMMPNRLLKSLLLAFWIGFGALIVIEAFWLQDIPILVEYKWGYFFGHLISYGALGYGYFHFVNLGVTARRVRLLSELSRKPYGMSEAELLAVYNARTMVKNRLGRLLSSGQVCMEDGRYRIGKPVLLQMALNVRRLKYFLLRKYSEFE